MTDSRPVLVITNLDDPTADLVIAELGRRGVPVARFDVADFPASLTMSARAGAGRGWRGRLQTPTRDVDLSAVRSVYHRRPTGFAFPHLDAEDARFATVQARHGLSGLLASLPDCLYVNHPARIQEAEYKPAQITAAAQIGFDIPETLITNDPDAARVFASEHGPVVYKPLAMPPYLVDGVSCTIPVAEVDPRELDDTVAGTAHLFQARVDKVADVRVTVIGERVFCVRIDSNLLDWRTDFSKHSYSIVEPPDGIDRALRAYLRRFGLLFGAFDFAVDRSGGWQWMECNPSGQWAWMEPETGLPMTAALADLLERGDGP